MSFTKALRCGTLASSVPSAAAGSLHAAAPATRVYNSLANTCPAVVRSRSSFSDTWRSKQPTCGTRRHTQGTSSEHPSSPNYHHYYYLQRAAPLTEGTHLVAPQSDHPAVLPPPSLLPHRQLLQMPPLPPVLLSHRRSPQPLQPQPHRLARGIAFAPLLATERRECRQCHLRLHQAPCRC